MVITFDDNSILPIYRNRAELLKNMVQQPLYIFHFLYRQYFRKYILKLNCHIKSKYGL